MIELLKGKHIVLDIHVMEVEDEPEHVDEWEAEEYHEDENMPDSSSPSDPDLENIEKESIIRALKRNNGSRKKAAEDLHISERSLYRKIEKYDIMKEVKQ